MASNTQSTRISAHGKIFKGILVVDIPSSWSENPLHRQKKEIPIRYWRVKPTSILGSADWHPSTCLDNTITDHRGRQIQFRIHNKAKNEKFLSEEFLQLCKGPSEVLCDGIMEDIQDNYFPYTMIFSGKSDWVFHMAENSCNNPIDFII